MVIGPIVHNKVKKVTMNKKHSNFKKGFSLMEVLVAVLVLSIGIAAVVTLMVINIKNVQTAKNQIVASFLAQEGAELVRNLKDSQKLNSDTSVCNYKSGDTCSNLRIDKEIAKNTDDLGLPGNDQLYLGANNFYVHDAGGTNPTKFYRKIDVDTTDVGIMKIRTYVTWKAGSFAGDCNIGNQCVSVDLEMPYGG